MDSVEQHYRKENLADRILAALEAAGTPRDRLTADDLSAVDEFHIRGREATDELLARAEFAKDMSILDVGCGIGGPARYLAAKTGCRVTGIDLTEAFIVAAKALTECVGMSRSVEFHHGDATAMPFEEGAFDGAWTLHVTMNIPDKPSFFREIRRVVRPGGRLALYEIAAGSGGEIHVPVPWASDPSISHLCTPDQFRAHVEGAGWKLGEWEDLSGTSLAWLRERLAAAASGPPPVGMHIILGPDGKTMLGNVARNVEEDRVTVLRGVAEAV